VSIKTRKLSKPFIFIIYFASVLIAVFELGFQMGFLLYLYNLFSAFGIYVPQLRVTLDVQQVQSFIMALVMLIVFILYPIKKQRVDRIDIFDIIFAIIGFISFIYIFFVFPELVYRVGLPTLLDVVMGVVAISLMLEATRRVAGPVLPLVALFFIAYGIWHGVNAYAHTENPLARSIASLINHIYLAKEGIFGTPLFVMVTYVYAFILFGAFLERFGIGMYITNFVLSLIGKKPGGPARVAVVASALTGSVSGSSVANVLTTGTFTIPMMKKTGLKPEMAAGVEAAASTGGQLMPPIMGAAAFIMAEFLGRPYKDVMVSGFLPALLYFLGVYIFIDFFTKKLRIKPLDEELPKFRQLAKYIYLLLPIPLITILLISGIPPQHAAIASLSVAIIASLLAQNNLKRSIKAVVVFTAVLIMSFLVYGLNIYAAIILLGVLIIITVATIGLVYPAARHLTKDTIDAVFSAGSTVVLVFLAAGVAGIVQGILTYTGLVTSIGSILIQWTGGNVYALLLITMAISLVLGMGVPTTANYIITSLVSASAVAHAISALGYDYTTALLAAHFFVFYFGILADVTPPVALAAYAASTIAQSSFIRSGVYAFKFALAGYLVPYMYALHPLMLVAAVTNWTNEIIFSILLNTASAVIGIYLLAAGVVGYLGGNLPKWLRAIMVVIAPLTVVLNPYETPYFLVITLVLLLIAYLKYRGKTY